ncbi:ribosome biogenesis GTPase YlqF [Candidatus Izemoplasma sp. B36]|uniref:ribosome biogenesis GTPase YlqF n=1 Tax=Candidatus Izemoplasma sp. B36 TaxID=3242468 RepID=UPI00355822D1
MKQIQWFPGHMAKARRLIEEKLPIIDIVYELLDARIPESSRNPMLGDIIKNKPKLVILNKSDLADETKTKEWLLKYEKQGINCIAVNSLTGNALNIVYKKTLEILKPLIEKEAKKGMKARSYRAIVIGIPNVGKSQFINNLAGKNKVKTGNIPGVTKVQSYIKTKKDLLLLDNPGILWPKFENEEVSFNLALLGSIKDDILPLDEVCIYGIKFLAKHYPNKLKERYGITIEGEINPIDIMDQIGLRRGCKISGGEIDYDRVINLFLYDLRNLKLGRITFEDAQDV